MSYIVNKRTCAAFLLSLLVAIPAMPFGFRPISMDFAPSGRESGRTFFVENNTEKPIAVRVRMYRREMDRSGVDILTDADDLFAVFPAQIALEPGQTQAVRVQWRGPADLEREEAFRIVAEQVPVQTDTSRRAGGTIQIMFRYRGSVYVLPPGFTHDVRVVEARIDRDEDGRFVEAVVENAGKAHVILQELTAHLTFGHDASAPTISLGPEELPGFNGENVLAGVSRAFRIALPDELPDDEVSAGEVSIELDFRPVR